MSEEITSAELDFFLRFPIKPHVTSPVDFLSNQSWGGICSLAGKEEFRNLDRDIETSQKRWKKIVEMDCPEREKFPQVRTLDTDLIYCMMIPKIICPLCSIVGMEKQNSSSKTLYAKSIETR